MVEVNDACSASTSTIAGFLVSGQVTIRWPRYLEEDRTSQRMPNQKAAASNAIAIIEPTAVSMFNSFLRLYDFACSDRSSSILFAAISDNEAQGICHLNQLVFAALHKSHSACEAGVSIKTGVQAPGSDHKDKPEP